MKKDLMGSLDLLERLNSNTTIQVIPNPEPNNNPDNTEELTLGLSLNGKYGWDPQTNNNTKLSRACSSVIIPEVVDVELSLNGINNIIPLSRTCSLPADEVEWRKRKEMQMLRRSEVKRKRVDQKMKKHSPPLPGKLKTEKVLVRFSSDGSSGGSSGVSDLDSQPSLGTNRDTSGTNEPSNTNKVQGNLKIATNDPVKTNKVQGNPKITPNVNCVIDQTMPCVSTKEDGPDGKRIQGFLYRYGKGEEVRIVCVCHGNFLTPAEFVKHGGGGNVEYPLRHIIVTPLFS